MYSISALLRAPIPGFGPFRHACTRYRTFGGRRAPISAFPQMAGHRREMACLGFGRSPPAEQFPVPPTSGTAAGVG